MNKQIFVFGSNEAGRHGAGSALEARLHWGAQRGVGWGRTGNAFAIPTKDRNLKTLPLHVTHRYIELFLAYAREHPELQFRIVDIGCGLAGYTIEQIAPAFQRAPLNCCFIGKLAEMLEAPITRKV